LIALWTFPPHLTFHFVILKAIFRIHNKVAFYAKFAFNLNATVTVKILSTFVDTVFFSWNHQNSVTIITIFNILASASMFVRVASVILTAHHAEPASPKKTNKSFKHGPSGGEIL